MEYLRWILLAGGILFVILIYVLGRRHGSTSTTEEEIDIEDLPSFSARDWDELEEGVGEVRIIARAYDDDVVVRDEEEVTMQREHAQPATRFVEEETAEVRTTETRSGADWAGASRASADRASADRANSDRAGANRTSADRTSADRSGDAPQQKKSANTAKAEVIVLYILAQPNSKLSGDRINTAVRANGMVFGEMNIFHRLDERGKPVYSLANMLEPGNFDPVKLQQIITPGVIVFMQLPGPLNPLACFNHMLQSASRIADMLDARLCNNRRQPLGEADTEALRKKVADFDG